MAKRYCFIADATESCIITEEIIDFTFKHGFNTLIKKENISALHNSIYQLHRDGKVLEVSSSSNSQLGRRLSAFNLMLNLPESRISYPVEVIFQASKVFSEGGPYKDLLTSTSNEAKRDKRLRTSGSLIYFDFFGKHISANPKTLFYDWIYIQALHSNKILSEMVLDYDIFTDIEFNHRKSINCQARSVAFYVSLSKMGKLDYITKDINEFRKLYSKISQNNKQLQLQI